MSRSPDFFASAQIIFRRGSRVLLMRRQNTGYLDGMYGLVAGHLDGGETATQAALRECLEEAGVRLLSEQVRPVHSSHRRSDDGREYFDIYFDVLTWSGEPVIAEPDKCDDLLWAALDALPVNTVPHVRHALAEIARGAAYSEFGWP
jgi:8-oxo-dGTP diphosphatase